MRRLNEAVEGHAGDDAPGKIGSAGTRAIIELALTEYLGKHERASKRE